MARCRCDCWLTSPREMDEICVPPEGTRALLGQTLRCEDPMPKPGALSSPPAAMLVSQQVELLLLLWEDSKSVGRGLQPVPVSTFPREVSEPTLCIESHCKSPPLGAVGCKTKIYFECKRRSPEGPDPKELRSETRKLGFRKATERPAGD